MAEGGWSGVPHTPAPKICLSSFDNKTRRQSKLEKINLNVIEI